MFQNEYAKKLVAVVMSSVMLVGFSSSAFASDAVSIPSSSSSPSTQSPPPLIESPAGQKDSIETQGWQRYLAKKAIQGISSALRSGANNRWVQKAINEYFDAETAVVFKKNLHNIADVLDEALELQNLATDWIYKQLYNKLYSVTKNHGITESITDGVIALISVFV
ncbi:hypothetical protein [Paenibacillus sp. Z6-24]